MGIDVTQARRVALYARVSTKDQDCERQTAELAAWAERCGYEVVERYAETGSGAKVDRALRARVMQGARERRYSAILVTEPSRWSRSVVDLIETLNEMAAAGVSLLSLTGLSMDMSTPSGRLVVSIMGSVAAFERELIVERVNSGIAAARRKGVTLGRPKGSKNKENRHTAAITKLLQSGFSIRGAAVALSLSPTTVAKVSKEMRANTPSG